MPHDAESITEELMRVAPWADVPTRARVAEGVLASHARWPGVALPLEAFSVYLAARWPALTSAVEAPRSGDPDVTTRMSDLYLACACSRADAEALRVFDRDVLRVAVPALRAMKQGQDFVDEVLQRARERLLVGSAEHRPRIEDYGGQGPLARWVRVMVVRLGLQLLRDRDVPLPDDAGRGGEPASRDPEREHLQARYAAWFKQAIKRVFAEVEGEDRRLLEMMVQERLSLSEIGERLGVNKSTISRRLTAIRVHVFDAVQRLARAELRVGDEEYASLVRLLQSQLDLSLGLTRRRPGD